jgi:CRISPR-associated protein Csm3
MAVQIRLHGKVFIAGDIKVETGLHIGGGDVGINIGGIDNAVIRNPVNNQPYIPGSSLKGKMRSLSEKLHGLPQNFPIQKIKIHVCSEDDYDGCDVCHIFGVPGDKPYSSPTRLCVRDVMLHKESLEGAKTDLEYTETKWEASIDRITSAAVPRQMERVPAGAIFKPFEFSYSVYDSDDIRRLKKVFEAMKLLEDDYLGGSGTRGSGKVIFENIEVSCRPGSSYGEDAARNTYDAELLSMTELLEHQSNILEWLRGLLFEG